MELGLSIWVCRMLAQVFVEEMDSSPFSLSKLMVVVS